MKLVRGQRPFEKGERVEVLFWDETAGHLSVLAGELGAFNRTHAEFRADDRRVFVVETVMLRRPAMAEEAA